MNLEDKAKRLQGVTETLQKRWGHNSLRKLEDITAISGLPTSTQFSNLDRALGIGGLPRGRITEVLGIPTSGMNSLAFKAVASAQSVGDMAVYIDPGRTFDPDYAARCGVKIASLLLVRSPAHKHIFEIARDLIASGGTGILVVGSDPCTGPEGIQTPSGALERLNTVLSGSLCAVIVLNAIKDNARIASANNALPYYATIRLQIEKERWLRRRRDIRGYRAWVTVLKNKLAPAGQRVTIAIGFSGVVRGDGA